MLRTVALVVAALIIDLGFGVVPWDFIAANDLGDAEGFRVKGCLGNQAIGKRKTENAGDACRETEEEDIPVKACGLLQGKLRALSNEGRD